MGIAKEFKSDSYDFPVAEANLTFTPSKYINMHLGYGRNFIGDGYRSLLLSNNSFQYPFLQLSMKFWRFKYSSANRFISETISSEKEMKPDFFIKS